MAIITMIIEGAKITTTMEEMIIREDNIESDKENRDSLSREKSHKSR